MADKLNKNSDTIITVSGVKHPITREAFSDGEASFTVYEALTEEQLVEWNANGGIDYNDLTPFTGAAANITMAYNASPTNAQADAQFYGTLPASIGDDLVLGSFYPVVATVTDGSALVPCVQLLVCAYNRGENAP